MDYKLLGKGKFGKVFEVEDYKGDKIALKIIKPEELNLVEIDILSRLKSPYLLRSLGEINKKLDGNEGITLELKENNLTNLNSSKISHGQRKRIIMSLLYGLECLHKKGFLHLDIKPLNCLYDRKDGLYTGYLSDFGFSLRCDDTYSGIMRKCRAGSLKYFPYEFLTTDKKYLFNDKSDVWSMGITILMFLGFSYKFKFSLDTNTEIKLDKIKKFWDTRTPEKIIYETVNNTDFSEIDKIDLTELLINMLKKDRDQRISSKNFNKLRFYNNNSLENTCYISKPKEILYIPYSSTNVIKGINQLNSYFETQFPQANIPIYFLSIEIFIRLMSITPMKISNQTLESHIQKSFLAAMKYYREIKLEPQQIKEFKNTGYDISKYLNGDIAPNRYYEKATLADDLVLIKEIIFSNYNLISLYSYLESDQVFNYFRQNYEYSKTKKEDIKTFEDLMKLEIPQKNTSKMIENDRDIFSYTNLKSNIKLNEEDVSLLNEIRNSEKTFREILTRYFKNKIDPDKFNNVKDIFRFYTEQFKDKDISVTELFFNKKIEGFSIMDSYFKYSIIKEDIFDKLEIMGDTYSDHIVFKSSQGNYSLLVRSPDGKEITHYYSNFNENLYEYFRKNSKEVIYKVNYDIKTSTICKINEICIIFLIYYNLQTLRNDYNLIYLEDETLLLILKISYYLLTN